MFSKLFVHLLPRCVGVERCHRLIVSAQLRKYTLRDLVTEHDASRVVLADTRDPERGSATHRVAYWFGNIKVKGSSAPPIQLYSVFAMRGSMRQQSAINDPRTEVADQLAPLSKAGSKTLIQTNGPNPPPMWRGRSDPRLGEWNSAYQQKAQRPFAHRFEYVQSDLVGATC